MEGTLKSESTVKVGDSIVFYQNTTSDRFNSDDYTEIKRYTPVLDGDYRVSFSFYSNQYTNEVKGAIRHTRNGEVIYQSNDYSTTDVSSNIKTITIDVLNVKKGDVIAAIHKRVTYSAGYSTGLTVRGDIK